MNKEVISADEQHGFVFNMRTISFKEEVCVEFLNSELTPESKRELLHAYYLHTFLDNGDWSVKTNYGDCQVKVNRSVLEIEYYLSKIETKLKGNISEQEMNEYVAIIEGVLNFNEKEQTFSQQIIVPIIQEKLE